MEPIKATGPFTQKLWEAALPVFREMIACEFTVGLAEGTLSKEVFTNFIAQDILYLRKDAEAFGIVAGRAENEGERSFFRQLQKDGIEIEQVLHRELARDFDLPPATEQTPAFAGYSNFLLYHAGDSPFAIAITALLPCYWLYAEKGYHILKTSKPGNPYQKFIDTYTGDEYEYYVRKFLEIVELHGHRYPGQDQAVRVFVEASGYELKVLRESMNR